MAIEGCHVLPPALTQTCCTIQTPSPILQLHWASCGHKPQQSCSTLVFRKCLTVAKQISHSLSKTYPKAITPPPLHHAAGYPRHTSFSLLENVKQPSLRTKHSLWVCTRGGEQEPRKTQKDDKGRSMNQTNYHQGGLGL